jgi:hypothetical protein
MNKQTTLFDLGNVVKVKQRECIQLICEPWLRKGWGLRHLFVGYCGSGKSNALLILNEYLKQHGIICIATDQKSRVSKYDSTIVVSETDLPQVQTRSCVIRGFAERKRMEDRIDFDELSRRIFVIGQNGTRVALVIDELSDAAAGTKSFTRAKGARRLSWLDTIYRQGRELGISIVAATQLPQEIPRASFSLSDTQGYFRQGGHESDYYYRLGILSERDTKILEELEDYEFILFRKSDPKKYRCKFEEA